MLRFNFVNQIVIALCFAVSFAAKAQTEPPQFMTVDGRLYDSTTPEDPLLDNSVLMKIQVLNPAKTCILYEEEQTVSTLSSNGYFNVRVGSPTSGAESLKRTTNDSGNSMMAVFQNQNASITGRTSGGGACSYTPAAGDTRYFRYIVTPSTTGVTSTLSPDMQIDSVPQALVAETLQGMSPDDFVQINSDVTQAKANSLFGGSYTTLTGLLAGTSSLYLRNTTNGTVIPSRATDPLTPSAGQIWYDSDDNVLRYYDGTVVQTLSSGSADPTKLPLAGGTMAGAIDMATNDITDIGHMTQAPQRTFRFGVYTTAQQTSLIATPLIAGHEGTVWYNTTTNKLMFWDGTAEYAVSPVDSVFGRTGAVVAVAGDYTATQITNTAAGNIAATDAQAAINELDTEKVAKSGDTMTGSLNIDNEQELRLSEADGSGTNYVAIKSPTTLSADYTLTLPATDGDSGQVLTTDGSGVLSWTSLAAVGETNTASNQGAGGVGLYDAKSGVDLQFRNINAASNKISVALDAGNKEVDLNVNEANLDTSVIPNTAAGTISATNTQAAINELDTEKVATTRAINTAAGSGLSGGGDLSADRSLSVNINGMTAETAVAGADEILIYDASASALRKMTRTNFVLSETEVDAMVSNNGYLTSEADTLATVTGRGASTATNITMNTQAQTRYADSAGGEYAAIQAPATIASNYVLTLPTTDGDSGQVLTTDGSGVLTWTSLAAVGETNTASNQGAGGVGLYDAKSGVDLQFRNINAASNKVSVALDAGNKEIDINVNEANLSTAAIPNTPAGNIAATNTQAAINELDTEKVATTRTINTAAGSGLTGGGDLSADRSLSVNINGTTAETAVAGADEILIYDASASALRKMTRTNFVLSESEVDAMVSNNGYLSSEADTLATVTARGATTATNITMNTQAQTRYADSAGGEYAAIQAPATIASNYVLTLPTTDGDSGQVLTTDGSGVLTWTSLAAVGETNTASNQGAGGVGLYDAKSGVDLQFRNINAANNKISVALDAGNKEVDINVNEANLSTASIPNTAAGSIAATNTQAAINELDTEKVAKSGDTMTGSLNLDNEQELRLSEADGSGANYVAIKALTTLGANYTLTLPPDDGNSGQYLQTDGNGVLTWVTPAGVGETNTASNQGAGGVGVFKQKTTYDLEFRNINAASNKISVALDAGNNEIDINVAEANLDTSVIPNTAAGTISATNTQAAINELDTEKVAKSGDTMTGRLNMGPSGAASGDGGSVVFTELASNGSSQVGFRAPDDVTTGVIWSLPSSDGAAGQLLQTNGSGVLSWVSAPVTGGTVAAGAGSSATPALSFSGDANTGFYNPYGDAIGITVNGNNIFTFDSNGMYAGSGIYIRPSGATSAVNPVYTFEGDDNTGMFRPAADTLGFSTAGTERMRISSTGSVGIGTTNPSFNLDVAGTSSNLTRFTSSSAGGNVIDAIGGYIRSSSESWGGYVLRNFGGTAEFNFEKARGTLAAPTYVLSGDGLGSFNFRGHASSTNAAKISAIATENHSVAALGGAITFATTQNTTTTNTERMRIDHNGNVGIGTTSPSTNLHVLSVGGSSAVGALLVSDSADSDYVHLDPNFGLTYNRSPAYINNNFVGGSLILRTSNSTALDTSAMIITSSGSVGIGSTSPAQKLDVVGALRTEVAPAVGGAVHQYFYSGSNATTNKRWVVGLDDLESGSNAGSDFTLWRYDDSGTVLGQALTINRSNGYVGIGSTAPQNKLDVWGSGDYTARIMRSDSDNTAYSPLMVARKRADATAPGANFGAAISYMLEGFTNDDMVRTATITSRWDANQTNDTTARDAHLIFATLLDNTLNEAMRITSAGNVGINVGAPAQTLEVGGSSLITANMYVGSDANTNPASNNTVGVVAGSSGYISTNRTGGGSAFFGRQEDGVIVQFYSAGTAEGSISLAGTTVSYNAFTGSHFAITDEKVARGELVSMDGEPTYKYVESGEPYYNVKISKQKNAKNILGAMLDRLEPTQKVSLENPYQVMAVGNGDMWVVDKGEDVQVGDYLIASDVPGHAEKDIGEFEIAHVVARVAENIRWKDVSKKINGVKHKKISVTFEQFDRFHAKKKFEAQDRAIASLKTAGDKNAETIKKLQEENKKKTQQIEMMKAYLCSKDPKAPFCN